MSKIDVHICCTSDVHGRMIPPDNKLNQYNSLSKVSSYLKEVRDKYSYSILIDNGDSIQGTPMVYYFSKFMSSREVHPYLLALDDLGYDVMVIGNHEFNYGVENLIKIMNTSPIPWLSANVVNRDTGEYFAIPYMIKEFNSLKVGIVGLTTRVPMWADPNKLSNYEISNELQEAKKCIRFLRPKVHIIIVSYHGGLTDEKNIIDPIENQGQKLIEEIDGIDVMITGHQHQQFIKKINKTLVIQPGAHAHTVGEIVLNIDKNPEQDWRINKFSARLVSMSDYHSDERFIERYLPYQHKADRWLNEKLCQSDDPLIIKDVFKDICTQENEWIEWLHLVQMNVSQVDISATTFSNPDFKGVNNYFLTRKDILDFFPYPDQLCIVSMTGEQIIDSLEISASFFSTYPESATINKDWLYPHALIYQYVMWEGLDYVIDVKQPIGHRVLQCTYHGQSLHLERSYKVVMPYFIARVASKFKFLHDSPILYVFKKEIPDLLMEDLMKRKRWDVFVNNNWKILL